jgi:proteasome alpha subunit
MGGQADALTTETRTRFAPALPLAEALGVAVGALGSVGGANGAPRLLPASQLEVAVLDRNRGQRKFRRITGLALTALLPAPASDDGPVGDAEAPDATSAPPADGPMDGS